MRRITGGSSGGSAAIGGQRRRTAGDRNGYVDSVSLASFCGVVGVKPTYGRISRYGIIPYMPLRPDHKTAILPGNVADACLALEVLAGRDERT